ncbi:unnamed protein product [Lampetra planeri]
MEALLAVRMRGAMRRSRAAEAAEAAPRGASELPRQPQPPEEAALRATREQSVTIVQHKIRNLEKKKVGKAAGNAISALIISLF